MTETFASRARATALALLFALFAASCGVRKTPAGTNAQGASSVPETSRLGSPVKIASLAPAYTKTLVRLGLADSIIAVDSWSKDIPGVPGGAEAFDMMRPDSEKLALLQPDILFVSEMTKAGTAADPFSLLGALGIRVVYLETPATLAEIASQIEGIARECGREEEGRTLISDMNGKIARVAEKARTIPQDKRKTVYFELSPAPNLYSFGSGVYLDELITLAGGTNILSSYKGWMAVGGETVAARNPDVILTNVSFLSDPAGEISSRAGWRGVRAVQTGQVYQINPDASSQPAPGIEDALEEIARAIYPEYFPTESANK